MDIFPTRRDGHVHTITVHGEIDLVPAPPVLGTAPRLVASRERLGAWAMVGS